MPEVPAVSGIGAAAAGVIVRAPENLAERVARVFADGGTLATTVPDFESRPGQVEMAGAVARVFEHGGILLAEAGTGTGKTLAYLVPAILSGRKVVVSTATHALQEQIFQKDVPLVREVLAEHGVTFRAALMKGLASYVCKRRLAERLRSGEPVTPDLARIEQWALGSEKGDRAEIAWLEEGAPAWRDV